PRNRHGADPRQFARPQSLACRLAHLAAELWPRRLNPIPLASVDKGGRGMVRVGGPESWARDVMRALGPVRPCAWRKPTVEWGVSKTRREGLAAPALAGAVATAVLAAAPAAQAGTPGSFIGGFHKLTTIGSTVPANGDINPYGTALVGKSQGSLVKGDVLVS